MVVSMRPIPEKQVVRAVQVTSRFPAVHGAPVQIGNPEAIGIRDLSRPDFGDPVTIREGEVPVFWACGVTPQAVAMEVKPDLMITHAPGHMFITDLRDEQFGVLEGWSPSGRDALRTSMPRRGGKLSGLEADKPAGMRSRRSSSTDGRLAAGFSRGFLIFADRVGISGGEGRRAKFSERRSGEWRLFWKSTE